jgi:hypothetical protein
VFRGFHPIWARFSTRKVCRLSGWPIRRSFADEKGGPVEPGENCSIAAKQADMDKAETTPSYARNTEPLVKVPERSAKEQDRDDWEK